MFDRRRHAAHYLNRAILVAMLFLALAGLTPFGKVELAGAAPPKAGKADVFPADNVWNRMVTDLPVHPLSGTYLSTIGLNAHFHADFGSGTWDGGPIGIPYVIVPGSQPKVPIHFTAYGDESDPGPMPIPPNAPIEGGPDSDGGRAPGAEASVRKAIADAHGQHVMDVARDLAGAHAMLAGSGPVGRLGPFRRCNGGCHLVTGLPVRPGPHGGRGDGRGAAQHRGGKGARTPARSVRFVRYTSGRWSGGRDSLPAGCRQVPGRSRLMIRRGC